MLYVTGDLHGNLERFQSRSAKCLKKGDSLFICGDFGFLWNGSKKEMAAIKKIGKFKFNILFVEGTHDNLSLISQYPLEDWNGGKVRRISGNLMKLERGSIFTIENKKILAFGGGESQDMDVRINDNLWWPEELPSPEELSYAKSNLSAHNNAVDYIISHECGSKVKNFIDMASDHQNPMSAFFDYIASNIKFKGWYFGCYHKDKIIPPYYHAMFQEINKLD